MSAGVIVSDEIWSDIILPGHGHVPTQSVSEDARNRTVALYAPSKTSNLAGLVGSYHIVCNGCPRDRAAAAASKSRYNEMSALSMRALVGACRPEGHEWVDELARVIGGNADWACSFIAGHFDGVDAARPEGTCMLFLDCSGWCAAHGRGIDWVLREGRRVGAGWQDGGPLHGPCHVRMNLALPLSRVREAFRRLDEHVFNAR